MQQFYAIHRARLLEVRPQQMRVSPSAFAGMMMRTLAAVLQSRALVWLGAVSYCLYLVNEPVQKLLGVTLAMSVQGNAALFTAVWVPGAVALPVIAAWWLHVWIETPALRWGRAVARRGMAAPVTVAG